MDSRDFDRLLARAHDPRLIPGIYNYCDGRCARCAFTDRCLLYQHQDIVEATPPDRGGGTGVADEPIERTLVILARMLPRDADVHGAAAPPTHALASHDDDPLVADGREYATLAWRVSRAMMPLLTARRDAGAIEAVDTIEWFSMRIASKLSRAVCGEADGNAADPQSDANGSAKMALLAVAESRSAWQTLMRAGSALANGVPARAVKTLTDLEAAIRRRFPDADRFVRPAFDDGTVAPVGDWPGARAVAEPP
jgi:hypothetical protein